MVSATAASPPQMVLITTSSSITTRLGTLWQLKALASANYPYEQQAALVEEFVCCRALAPAGTRTAKLHDLLAPAFPDIDRQSPTKCIAIPWAGAETRGICSAT